MTDLSPKRRAWAMGSRPYEFYPTIGSTNDRAMSLLLAGAAPGIVVLADEQTAGRGRLGRAWHSPPGSALMLSIVLRPPSAAQSDVGMLGALIVCEAVEALGAPSAEIKWPNDVQVDGRKLCGVLPEAAWKGSILAGVVLGMGVNVSVDFSETPFQETAISLGDIGASTDRARLLRALLDRFDQRSAQLGSDLLFEAWRARLNMLGRTISVVNTSRANPADTLRGTAEGVDRDGALRLRGEDGAVRRVIAGDIAFG
ncbi:MAG: biotin--[acetyl-CoA-carboxylase] ligase [Anaerolineae bacterium]|nr:biotin--[acetyl-CoA-carboxylase] ligase [Anaerolineae bacterium]NUQ04254.1 biotin--[acetyl-CoA-carboxylase] ligase [Anaerolineae bacterium]